MIPTARAKEPAFAERFLLARFPDGGVVVDLESGNYYRINQTAALVCATLREAPDRPTADSSIAGELHVDAFEAARIVNDVLAALQIPSFRGEIQGSYHFSHNDSGYELRHGENRVLEISADSMHIRFAAGAPTVPSFQLEQYVRALAPKLLFQRGVAVLHASACLLAGQVLAFAGVSGAGKTTTAQAFASQGADLISEDLIVLAPDAPGPMVLVEGESRIRDWARRATSELASQSQPRVFSDSLAREVLQGPTIPLKRLLFVDCARRAGPDLRTRSLEASDALLELLRHSFLGAKEPDSWRRFFRVAVTLRESVEILEASTPDGLEELGPAAARYMATIAS